MLNNYVLFGLNIESEVDLPGLTNYESRHSSVDVAIQFGDVPRQIKHVVFESKNFQVSADECLMEVEGIGRIWICGGNVILIAQSPNYSTIDAHLFLTGTGMSTILKQRGYFILHASASKMGDQATIFLGDRGAGKSTLVNYLSHHGHALLSDDICALRITENGCELTPSFPRAKLSMQSISLLSHSVNDLKVLEPIGGNHCKAFVYPQTFCEEPLAVSAFILLTSSPSTSLLRLSRVDTIKRLAVVQKQNYRSYISRGVLGENDYFKVCASVAEKVNFLELSRPITDLNLRDVECFLKTNILSSSLSSVG